MKNICTYLLIVSLFVNCSQGAKFERDLKVSVDYLCCKKQDRKLLLKEFEITDGHEFRIELCEQDSNFLERIILTSTENRVDYKISWDLIVQKRSWSLVLPTDQLDGKIFRGDFKPMQKLRDGHYILDLVGTYKCGQIKFQVKREEIVGIVYNCTLSCGSEIDGNS